MGTIALGACAVAAGGAGAANAAPGDPFTISGDLDRTLFPGGSGLLDLRLTNVSDGDLTVGEITVQVASVTTQPQQTCLVADFAVTQIDAARQFALPANTSRTLTELGMTAADLPQVSMTNTSVNQDGCKRATVNLVFNARAAEVGGVVIPPRPTPTPVPPGDDDDDGNVGGVDLPGTGGDPMTFWMALAGLGLVVLGGGTVVVTRHTKGAQR